MTATANPVPALFHQAAPSLSVTEWALAAGYDGVVVDLQHGEIGLEAACTMLRATPRTVTHAYARVGSADPAPILRLLDSGATGIIVPTVESAAQAAEAVDAVKYPPVGRRSLGPSRPALYPGASYVEAGNAAVTAAIQIETALGVERAEEILATPGLDAVYIGPADLAVTYGLPGRGDWTEGPVREAITEIAAIARRHGVRVGIYCASPEYARGMIDAGEVNFIGLGIDLVFLGRATREAITALRGEA